MSVPSIRRSLLIRSGGGIGALMCLLSAGIYLMVRQSSYEELDESISQTAALLANQVEYEDYSINFEWQEGVGTNRALVEHGLFQFWEDGSGETTRSPGLGFQDLPKFSGVGGKPMLRNVPLPDGRPGRAIGLRVYPFVLPAEMAKMKMEGRVVDLKTLPHTLVVARNAEPVQRILERLRWVLALGTLLTLGLGFIIIQRLVGVSLRPIDDLTAQMQDRAEHQLDLALEVPEELPSELAGLARSFDALLARVAAIRLRERDFIRHAAHELRTPIAALRATTDLALSQPREAAAYAAHLATCQDSAIELSELVKRLTALARLGQANPASTLEPVDLARLLRVCLEPFLPRADESGLKVNDTVGDRPLMAQGDATLLRIIFNNLFDNAVAYTPAGGEIRIFSFHQGSTLKISLSNPTAKLTGPPERFFEPLFRSDASRSDSPAHLGVGLSLSLEAARAMGAGLSVEVPLAGQIVFTLSLPVA